MGKIISGGNRMVKAIFFDVDGTLVSHTANCVPQSARNALAMLSEKGIRRIVATGRSLMELAILPVKDIAFDGYVLMNGQLCLDGQKNVIAENPMSGADKERLLHMFNEKLLPIVLVEKERLYINFVNRHVELAQKAVNTPIPEIGTYTGNKIYLAAAFLEKSEDEAFLLQLPGCKVTRWNHYAVDIVADSGGKVAGIEEYLKFSHIKKEETMAFGDGENDVDMLKFVQTGVAMGNAEDITKENADFVTDSVDDDGIMNALCALHVLD